MHDLIGRIGQLPDAQGQGRIHSIPDDFEIFAKHPGFSISDGINGAGTAGFRHADQGFGNIGSITEIPLLFAGGEGGLFSPGQLGQHGGNDAEGVAAGTVGTENAGPDVAQLQAGTGQAGQLAGTELGDAVTGGGKAGGVGGDEAFDAAVLRLAARADKDAAVQGFGGFRGEDGAADVLRLDEGVIPVRADGAHPGEMKEGVCAAGDQLRKPLNVPHIELEDVRFGGKMADPGIGGVTKGPGFHTAVQQSADEGLAYGAEGTVDNCPAELKRFTHLKASFL